MEKSSLNSNDRQRIYTIAHKKYSDPFENIDRREGYMEGYKDATIYEREKQAKEIHDLESLRNELISNQLGHRLELKELDGEIKKLEAERSEVRNKVIELEQTIRKIQDKAIELYGNQIELP